MEAYTRKNLHPTKLTTKQDLDFQIISWNAIDESDENELDSDDNSDSMCTEKYTIRCFGSTAEGVSVTCKIKDFTPFFFVKVPDSFSEKLHLSKFIHFIKSHNVFRVKDDNDQYVDAYSSCVLESKCLIVRKMDMYGFHNGRKFKFVRLVFNNNRAMQKAKYIFKNSIFIRGVNTSPERYKLYESFFEPYMRFCHLKEIKMAGWARLPKSKYKLTKGTARTGIEVEIKWTEIESLKDRMEMANFLQASWDIETYSWDRSFPDPTPGVNNSNEKNVIYQMATTFKYYNDKSTLVKHLLTLKNCSDLSDPNDKTPVIVECMKTEKELILRWLELMQDMDPDIIYTYNGDSFDYRYLYERCKMHGLKDLMLKTLSRLKYTPTVVKQESFISSAYGDSNFTRLYIPGRLNYDLLIHYKRGMKKYPSYKLDYIANEILKEGKHGVTAKEIFDYYDIGTAEKIGIIGKYCIQDTELLQKLVDKQLVLITIVQLANVTYVPVEYLTTRGQTIKVLSQILRKARQMGYLVPHTNFNENSYPVIVKTSKPHKLTIDDIKVTYLDGLVIETTVNKDSGVKTFDRKSKRINGCVSVITDDHEFVMLLDNEISKEFKNIELLDKKKNIKISASEIRPDPDAVDDSFTGATVLEAHANFYTDNIAVLDFASLYPTIMISRNLCFSTFVMDSKYKACEGVKYENLVWNDKIEYKMKASCCAIGKSGKTKGLVCQKPAFFEKESLYYCRIHDPEKKTRQADEKFQKKAVSYDYTVVQPSIDPETGERINIGVLPSLLEELYAERKRVKREMAKAKDTGDKLLADILDSTQLAIKVSLNSTYGFLGRGKGNLILKELGSIVTSVGRQLIEQSKAYVEGPFIEHIRESKLVTAEIKKVSLSDISEKEKDIILSSFKA